MSRKEVLDIVLPGDVINTAVIGNLILGPGLVIEGDQVLCCKPGVLHKKDPNVFYVQSAQKRYIPAKGDHVVGVVSMKAGDVFRVDVGGSVDASLPFLTFEGASKKNRPDVKLGDVVYARVTLAGRDTEPQLSCVDGQNRGQGMGVLREGVLVRCPLHHAHRLLNPKCPVLKTLGKTLTFEATVGVNGRIWVKGQTSSITSAVVGAIEASEYMTEEQARVMGARVVEAVRERFVAQELGSTQMET